MNLEKSNIIITDNNTKQDILLNIKDDNNLVNIKFFVLDEFIKKYYFDYTKDTIYYLVNKYNISIELANKYISFLYFIEDKQYKNKKLQELKLIKEDLINNNLLIFNKLFKDSLKDENIILMNYPNIDEYFINDFKKLNKFSIYEKETNIYKKDIYTFNEVEEEISFVAESIIKLLQNNVDINDIYLYNLNDEYKILIDRIFKMYDIPIYLNKSSNILNTKVARDVIKYINNDKTIDDLNYLFSKIYFNNPNNRSIINVLNNYPEDYKKYIDFIINDFKNIKTNLKPDYKHIKELKTNKTLSDNEYVFVLGFNNEYPKYKKDEDYILDHEKEELMCDNTTIKNKKIKRSNTDFLLNNKNVIITYSKQTLFNNYEMSSLFNDEYMSIKNTKRTNFFDNTFYKYMLAKKIDTLITYNTYDEFIDEVYEKIKFNYLTYDNKFTGINPKILRDHLNNKLSLSYSSMENYYDNSFVYYIKYILRIDPFEESFYMKLGTITHDILETVLKDNTDFNSAFNLSLSKYELNNKESFYLNKLKVDIEEIIKVLNIQKDNSQFKDSLYEANIEIKYNLDYDLTFKGFIDKVNYLKLNNKTYVTLVDYKTGKANIDLNLINHGLNMQLPVYSYLINKSDLFENPLVIGFYLQTVLQNKNKYDKKISLKEETINNLKLKGYTIDDPNLIELIDTNYYKDSFIDKLRLTKSGDFYKSAKVMSEEKINDLTNTVEEKILYAAENIMNAKFNINPKVYKNKIYGYNYNKYRDVCFYTPSDLVYLEEGDQDD